MFDTRVRGDQFDFRLRAARYPFQQQPGARPTSGAETFFQFKKRFRRCGIRSSRTHAIAQHIGDINQDHRRIV